mgnify:FL=1
MAQLPRYQRLGVRTRQPGSIDFADTREQARYSQNLSQQLDRMSQFAFKEAARAATIRGQERVQEEGAVSTLEAIDEKGGAFTIADRAAYELGSRVAVAEIQNTAEIEISRILTDGEKNETPFSVIQSQLADVTDGYSESLRVIDPTASSVLKVNLQGAAATATEKYSNYYVKLQAQKQAVKRSNAAERGAKSVLESAILPGMTMEEINKKIAVETELQIGLGATESEATEFAENVYNAAYKEKLVYEFNVASLEEKQEMLTTMETQPLPGMTLSQTQTVRKSLKADYNSALAVTKGENNAVVSEVAELERVLALGGMPSEKQIVTLKQRADALGDQGAAARLAIADLEFNAENASVYRSMTAEDLYDEVESLKSGIQGLGGTGIDTLLEAETLQVAQAYLTAAKTAMKAASDAEKAQFEPIVDALSSDVSTFQDIVDKGIAVNPEDMASLVQRLAEIPPNLRGDLQGELGTLLETGELGSILQTYTPAQIADYMSDLRADGVDTSIELKQLNLAEKMLSNMETQLADDPLTFAMNVGVKDSNNNQIQISTINPTAQNPDVVANVKKRVVDAQVIASKYGVEPKFFTAQERDLLTEFLKSPQTDRSKLMSFLGSIVEGGGPAVPQMLSEISSSSPEFAGIGALVNEENMSAANFALRGLEYLKAGNEITDFTPTNTKSIFLELTDEALKFAPNTKKVIQETARLIYADISRGQKKFSTDLWRESIEMASGMKVSEGVSVGGIQEVRGKNTLLPAGVSAEAIENALNNIDFSSAYAASNQVVDAGILSSVNGDGIINTKNDWQVLSLGGNMAGITFGSTQYGEPKYVTDLSGAPFRFDIMKLIEAVQ